MIIDSLRKVRVVALFITQDSTKATLTKILIILRNDNKEWQPTVALTDNDDSQIGALRMYIDISTIFKCEIYTEY